MVTSDICPNATVEAGCPVDHDQVRVFLGLYDPILIGIGRVAWPALLLWFRLPVWISRHEITDALGNKFPAFPALLQIPDKVLVIGNEVSERGLRHSGVE